MATRRIHFRFNHKKALEVLVWLASNRPRIGYFHVAKVVYFADKLHLERYGRPILGDWYAAMEHGPVPSTLYDMLKRNELLGDDIVDAINNALVIDPRNIRPLREPDLSALSQSDLECLGHALRDYGWLSFSELRDLVHAERAWVDAMESGSPRMDYALMVGEVPERDALIADLQEKASHLVI